MQSIIELERKRDSSSLRQSQLDIGILLYPVIVYMMWSSYYYEAKIKEYRSIESNPMHFFLDAFVLLHAPASHSKGEVDNMPIIVHSFRGEQHG